MAQKPLIYNIFDGLSKAVEQSKVANTINKIPCIYIEDRPTDIDEKVSAFVVIDLPNTINRMTIAGRDQMTETTGVLYLFVRAKADGTSDILSQTKRTDALMGLFPITTEYFVASSPRRVYSGRDTHGFQVTSITFQLRTRFNADLI